VSKGKVGAALALSHEFSFKAHSPADAEKWWNVIRSAAGSEAMTGEMAAQSEPSSPVDSRSASGTQPPIYEKYGAGQQPAPVQTQGLQQGQSGYPQSAGGGQQHTSPQGSGGVQETYDSPTGPAGRDYAGPQSAGAGGMGVQSATGPQDSHSGVDRAPGQY